MLRIAAIPLVALPLLAPAVALAQPGGNQVEAQEAAAAPAAAQPIPVRPMTVLDHLDTLAGERVELAPCTVVRVLSVTLVELRDAQERGRYGFQQWDDRDTLLALLPAGAKVLKGDTVVVTGTVKTVAGASLDRGLTGVSDEVLEDKRNHALLVASSVATVDAVSMR